MIFVAKRIVVEHDLDCTDCLFDVLNECYLYPEDDVRITQILLLGYSIKTGHWEGVSWIG